jgi:transcriptional regulator with GAF, ATPase, and Fis domain
MTVNAMAILRIVDGFGAGQSYQLAGARTTIGRDAPNPVQIGDPKSSRVHAEIVVTDGKWQVRDLGSSNGTWNEEGRITSMPLGHGAVFRIGSTYFRFETLPGGDAGATLADTSKDWSDPDHLVGLDDDKGVPLFRAQAQAAAAANANELARANTYLVLLHRLVLAANKATSRDQLFEVLDDAAAEVLEGDRCAVFLPVPVSDGSGWVLWPPHERRLRARFGAVPFARTLLSAVRTRKEPLLCTLDGDINPSASMVSAGVRSAMAAPLRIGDELHAALYVDRLEGDSAFTRIELEFLAAVANQLAVQLHGRSNVAELEAEVVRLKSAPKPAAQRLLGDDPAIKGLESFIAGAAVSASPVLILGESGTGKELVARAIHAASPRAERPLQVAGCAALGEQLVEAALFGHAKGAGGAEDNRPGLFELADHATVLLDEVGELPPAVQARLLRVLEQGEVQRIGEAAVRTVDVRLIATSNRDLREEVKAGRFRADLLHRLDALSVSTPTLRSRAGDLELLIDHFLRDNAQRLSHALKRFSPEARGLLLKYHWPGNVRQLKNTIERACIMAADRVIQASDLPEAVRGPAVAAFATPLASLQTIERAHILRVLEHCGGNKKAAAELLEIDRSTLYAKLRQYGQA